MSAGRSRREEFERLKASMTPFEKLVYSPEYSDWYLKKKQLEAHFNHLRERGINPEYHPPFVEERDGFYARECFFLHRRQAEIKRVYGEIITPKQAELAI